MTNARFEGTPFTDDNEEVYLHRGNDKLLSLKEVQRKRAEEQARKEYREAIELAFRTIQLLRVSNHEAVYPQDPSELVKVISLMVVEARRQHLESILTGEVNAAWLYDDQAPVQLAQMPSKAPGKVVSLEGYRNNRGNQTEETRAA